MDKKHYDLWAEVPSPIKSRLRNVFSACAEELNAYIPAQVGGNMTKEEYLKEWKPEDLPDSCFLMDFGECSDPVFAALAEKVYEKPKIQAWFPEVMALDLRRLNGRKHPETYDDLLREDYLGEICLIGNVKMPDPLTGLYVLRKHGLEGLNSFVRNVAPLASPSETLRHVGHPSNSYGSIFLMPPLFAQICLGESSCKGRHPSNRSSRQPMLLYQKSSAPAKEKIRTFFESTTFRDLMADYQMPVFGDHRFRIDESCGKLATEEELTIVFQTFRNHS
ncbi:MAG: ABC transporter substrate-binding protein [Lachnospiraceae bacterium]